MGRIPSGKYTTVEYHCFLAEDCIKIAEPKLDEKEFLEVVEMPLSEYLSLLKSGRSRDHAPAYFILHNSGLL